MVTEDSSSDGNASSGDEPSSSASAESSDPSEENIPYVDQLARAMIDSAGSSEDDTGPSGFTSDELIFQALETDYDDDGNGLDIDGIFNFIEERYEILDDFREQLEDQLGDLVSECQVEKVGNRYKIPHGHFDTPRQPGEASNPTKTVSSEDSSSAKPRDTSSTSSFVPTSPEENPQKDAAVKEVEEAEHLEFQAKEAHPTCNKIPHGHFDTPRQPGETSNPTQTESSEDFSSMKPEDTPSTSSSFVPTAPEENPQIDAAVKEVAEAEDLEFQAKEAQELADKHAQLLKLESHINLQLAVEILNRCNVHISTTS